MIPGQIQLYVPCDLNYRDAISALLGQVCKQLVYKDKKDLMSIQVISAFNEAFNNVVKHSPQIGTPLEICVEITKQELVIEIKDEAAAIEFDINDVPLPELTDLPESGLGLFIIKSFMDKVEYYPGGGNQKNRFRMVRKLLSAN